MSSINYVKSVQMRSWCVFSRICTEYGDLPLKSPYSSKTGKYGPEKSLYIVALFGIKNLTVLSAVSLLGFLKS